MFVFWNEFLIIRDLQCLKHRSYEQSFNLKKYIIKICHSSEAIYAQNTDHDHHLWFDSRFLDSWKPFDSQSLIFHCFDSIVTLLTIFSSKFHTNLTQACRFSDRLLILNPRSCAWWQLLPRLLLLHVALIIWLNSFFFGELWTSPVRSKSRNFMTTSNFITWKSWIDTCEILIHSTSTWIYWIGVG